MYLLVITAAEKAFSVLFHSFTAKFLKELVKVFVPAGDLIPQC